jgi:RNA recognition motif-containing protein
MPTHKEKEASFNGAWLNETRNGDFEGTIDGSKLTDCNGNVTNLRITGSHTFEIEVDGDSCSAELRQDGKIHWSDGDIWIRREVSLNGKWTLNGDYEGTIEGSELTDCNGNVTQLRLNGECKFEMDFDGGTLTAELQDTGELHWSDGDVWIRQEFVSQQSTEAPVPRDSNVLLENLPRGTSRGLIFAECQKYAKVYGMDYNPDNIDVLNRGQALVTFETQLGALTAASKLAKRLGLFGSEEPIGVRFVTSEEAESMAKSKEAEREQADARENEEEVDPAQVAQMAMEIRERRDRNREFRDGRPREKFSRYAERPRAEESERYNDRDRRPRQFASERSRSRDRRARRFRSCSRERSLSPRPTRRAGARLERSRSPSLRGPSPPLEPRESRARRATSGFDNKEAPADSNAPGSLVPGMPADGKRVITKGNWAEITIGSDPPYYAHLLTGAKTFNRPPEFGPPAIPQPGQPGQPNAVLNIAGTPVNSNVYVGMMPKGINEFEFRSLFAPFGNIMSTRLMGTRNGGVCGFVKYTSYAEAQHSINQMNGLALQGTKLKVKMAEQDNLGFNPALLRLAHPGLPLKTL